jgi:hypothetical protein
MAGRVSRLTQFMREAGGCEAAGLEPNARPVTTLGLSRSASGRVYLSLQQRGLPLPAVAAAPSPRSATHWTTHALISSVFSRPTSENHESRGAFRKLGLVALRIGHPRVDRLALISGSGIRLGDCGNLRCLRERLRRRVLGPGLLQRDAGEGERLLELG